MESNKIILLAIFFCIIFQNASAQYQADVLGDGFEQKQINMPNDYEGKVIITVVRKQNHHKKAVLYIHGFCDYFFQKELADQYLANGFDFYAVDLRKYGRSIMKHQIPNNCKNISEYFADIDSAIALIKQEGHDSIQINAHSTGGLIALSYAQKNTQKNDFYKLVLNSPFVDMNQNFFNENIAIPIVAFLGKFFPNNIVPDGISTLYGESIYKGNKGEWDYNLNWKPLLAFDVNWGWLHAIHQAQKEIQHHYQIQQEILVCSSDHSTYETVWSEKLRKGDAVLSVNDIQQICSQFKAKVKFAIIPDGIHDLSLSEKSVRSLYFQHIFN